MPGFLIHQNALIQCPHLSPITVVPPSPPRVFVNAIMPVLTVANVPTVAPGCTFTLPGPKPSPCVRVQLTSATRVFINAQPAAILTPAVLCLNAEQVPQGPPNSMAIQTRVIAT
jgi:hypothetical protein